MKKEKIIILNGCFWGAEYALRNLTVETEVGYAGAKSEILPTYYNLDVTGHSEAVRVCYDTDQDLIDVLKIAIEHSNSDPSPSNDPRYRRAILCSSPEQMETVKEIVDRFGYQCDLEVSILFYPADKKHQRYLVRSLGE